MDEEYESNDELEGDENIEVEEEDEEVNADVIDEDEAATPVAAAAAPMEGSAEEQPWTTNLVRTCVHSM